VYLVRGNEKNLARGRVALAAGNHVRGGPDGWFFGTCARPWPDSCHRPSIKRASGVGPGCNRDRKSNCSRRGGTGYFCGVPLPWDLGLSSGA